MRPRVVTVVAMLCAVSACSAESPPPSAAPAPTVTATMTVTVTQPAVTVVVTASATPTSTPWPADTDVQGEAPSPEFPAALDGWQLVEAWSALPRAFTGGSWSQPPGPYDASFPATMNGCDTQRFLVRWRAVDETATVLARWNTQDIESGSRRAPTPDGWTWTGAARPSSPCPATLLPAAR